MQRRRFLQLVGLAATPPLWVRRLRADATIPGAKAAPLSFGDALTRARADRRAMLVLVIPANDATKWERGRIFGEILNHGSDADLAPLAGVDVVAATMATVRAAIPAAPANEPLMLVINVDGTTAAIDPGRLPDYESGRGRGGNWQEMVKKDDATADKRIAIVGTAIRRGLGAVPGGDVARLAAEARLRYVKRRVPGSHWATAGGCGTSVEEDEGDDGVNVACGMGHVPAKSARFLYLYAQTPGQARREAKKKEQGQSL